MSVARGAMLFVATLLVLLAFGADLQPSALYLMSSCTVALLAPLFWPGSVATVRGTMRRVLLWSAAACAVATLAAVALAGVGPALLYGSAMLAMILLVSHSWVAALERRWLRHGEDGRSARDLAGRSVTLALAALGSLPLWLGPMAEQLSAGHPSTIDTVLGISPLTHLAVAYGNDLLRNAWLYQHSNLAGLQADYPDSISLVWAYAGAGILLGGVALQVWRREAAARNDPFLEK